MSDDEPDLVEPVADGEASVEPAVPVDFDRLIVAVAARYPELDPWATGRGLGMTEKKIRMGIALLSENFTTATAAAKAAGYGGEGSSLRSTASKTERSKQMQQFLAEAKNYKSAVAEKTLTDEEMELILSRNARRDNPAVATRAIEALQALRHDIARSAKDAADMRDPVLILRDIARISPLCATIAAELARVHAIDFRPMDTLALPAGQGAHVTQADTRLHNMNGST